MHILIVGAGTAGQEIASEIKKKPILGKVISFIDDDVSKIGSTIDGIPVFGPINKFKNDHGASEAIIAIPSADKLKLNSIYNSLKRENIEKIKILPAISQVINGDAHLILTRDIRTEDLLGRDPIAIDLKESLKYLKNKRVLITGSGGSIGSELASQLLYAKAQRIYLLDSGENQTYEIHKKLQLLQQEGVGEKTTIVPIICNLQDKDHLNFIMPKLNADIIFHCAAYKHVPLMEDNSVECIKNNVFGTKYLLDAAKTNNISKFVLISTDKAVDPSCTYGVSKLLCEQIVLKQSKSNMVVRFGNVLDSNGSIIPHFRSQIASGGPVTVTHPDVSRFFMTIPEACSLVLKAGGVGKPNNTYILDMGDPVKIYDLAKQMIQFSGFEPNKDIEIKIIGLRKGEKLHEKLWTNQDSIKETEYNRIMILKRDDLNIELDNLLNELKPICFFDKNATNKYRNSELLAKVLKSYYPTLKD